MGVLRLVKIGLAALSPVIFLQLFPLLNLLAPPPADRAVQSVEVLLRDQLTPPVDAEAGMAWVRRTLPLEIRSIRRQNSVWYRIVLAELPGGGREFTDAGGDEPWLLSVGAPFGAVAVFRNDELIAEVGGRTAPLSVFRWPVDVTLLPAQFDASDVLYVHFQRPNSTGWVYMNYFGPQSEMQPYVTHQQFLRVDLPQWIQVIMCAIGVFMLVLFRLRPDDPQYGWWGLMLFAWALREATDLAVDPWVSDPHYWVAIRALALGSFALCGYMFIKSFLRMSRTVFDPAVWVSALVWTGLLLWLAHSEVLTRELSTRFWTPWVVFIAALCCVQLGRAALASIHRGAADAAGASRDVGALLVVCWFISSIGVYDYKAAIDPYAIAGYIQYLQYSAGFALIVFTLILVRRFAGALGAAEQANLVLEDRIAEQKLRLDQAYEREREVEKQRLVLDERERIMQDMHDGIGGQLVQALSIVSDDPKLAPIEPALRQALDDLRLIIDSLSVPDGSLPMLLASFRHRLVRPIERAGLKFEWQLADLPDTAHLSQSELLHVLRILQEAVTNVLKHAGATRLRIETDLAADPAPEGGVRIRVTDNGRGFIPEHQATAGRGLRNMRKRAETLGAQLYIGPDRAAQDRAGNLVELVIPLGANPKAG